MHCLHWDRLWLLWLAICFIAPSVAGAGALLSRQEALTLAFPEADSVTSRHVFLADDDVAKAEKLGGVKIDGRLWTFYAGYQDSKLLGYAVIDTQTVRTLPETVMVVLEPEGKVRSVHMLAFYEPAEYMPRERWLEQFAGKNLAANLRLGSGIQAVTGATLSARSLSDSVRRVLGIFAVGIKER